MDCQEYDPPFKQVLPIEMTVMKLMTELPPSVQPSPTVESLTFQEAAIRHNKTTKIAEEPVNEWTEFDEIHKDKKRTYNYALDIEKGNYNIYGLITELQLTTSQFNSAVDKEDRMIEITENLLLLYFHVEVSGVCSKILHPKQNLKAGSTSYQQDGKARQFYATELASVKYINTVSTTNHGSARKPLKFACTEKFTSRKLASLDKDRHHRNFLLRSDGKELKHNNYSGSNNIPTNLMGSWTTTLQQIFLSQTKDLVKYGKKKLQSTLAKDDVGKRGF